MKDYRQYADRDFANYFPGTQVKLPNRRVALWRHKDGSVFLRYKTLAGWKKVSELVVPLSAEAAQATLHLLGVTQPRQVIKLTHKVEVPDAS